MVFSAAKDTLLKIGAEYGPVIAAQGKKVATEQLPNAGKAAVAWAQHNPSGAVGATLGVAGGVALFAPAAVALAGLSVAGFGSAGVIAGGTAAGVQTPAVIAGSWFALCQSAAAGGAGLGVVSAVTQASGAAIAGAGGLLAWMGNK